MVSSNTSCSYKYFRKTRKKTDEITNILKNKGFRVNSDLRNEKIAYKIRHHSMQKVPFIIVLGDKEIETSTLAIRDRSGSDLGSMSIDAFSKILNKKLNLRRFDWYIKDFFLFLLSNYGFSKRNYKKKINNPSISL